MKAIKTPSRLWYLAHSLFWVVTGIICYIIWRDDNIKAAKKHLIYSIWLPFVWSPLLLIPFMFWEGP